MKIPYKPVEFIINQGRKHPNIWKFADTERARRGDISGRSWPDYVFLPVDHVEDGMAVKENHPIFQARCERAACAALAWRPTQDIVHFDADVYAALTNTPPSNDLPDIIFKRLPAWCMYIDLYDEVFHGFFVLLDFYSEKLQDELYMVLLPHDSSSPPSLVVLPLGYNSIQDGINQFFENGINTAKKFGDYQKIEHKDIIRILDQHDKSVPDFHAQNLLPTMISLTLYLCSEEAEWGSKTSGLSHPTHAEPTKTKKGWRLFPPDAPRIWYVGEETGIQIRASRSTTSSNKGMRPHIRRAHWHTYWTGRKVWKEGETPVPQIPKVRWLPPIPVALQQDITNEET